MRLGWGRRCHGMGQFVKEVFSNPTGRMPASRAGTGRDPGAPRPIDGAQRGSPALGWLRGEGEMVERIRTFDWEHHPLGRPESWPQNLSTALSICLASRFPILLWWGPEL